MSDQKQTKVTAGVFVRESTGLVKNVSFLDSVALNISNMSMGALLGVLGITFVSVQAASSVTGFSIAGVNLVAASILGFILAIPQFIVYTMMSLRFPRTGGDYIYVSRVFGGFWGSTLSFMGYTLETTAYLALIVLSAVFAIGAVGLVLGMGGSLALGLAVPSYVPGSNPIAQFTIGALIFSVLIAVNIFKPKYGYKLVSAFTIIGIATVLLAIAVLLTAGHEGVVNYFNSLNIKGLTYDSVASSYKGPSFDLAATLFIMPVIAAFVYPWINATPAVASEVKGKTALKWNITIAAVTVFLLLTGALATLYYVGGQNFINAALSNPLLVFDYSFNFWTLAMGVSNNFAIAFILGLGWIVWNLGILAYGIIVISRYLLAQSFDRFLPARISYVSPKYGSPVVAHAVDLIITIALVGAAAVFYKGFESLFGAILASMAYFVFVGLAAAVYGLKKETGRARVLLVVFGILDAIVFAFLAYEFAAYPMVWGLNSLTYTFIILSFILGAAIYLTSKRYHLKRGIDISLAYKELPPE